MCFLNVKSRGLRYEANDGTALRIDLTAFPHVALWSKPPASFLAIEAWTGHGDPETFTGDLAAKPSMRLLPPGACTRHAATFMFQPNF
jgi:galactose mutarotase-like enzyme